MANKSLVTKVYFPRLVAPIAPLFAALVDFLLAFGVLLILMTAYGILPGWRALTLPFFVFLAMLTSLAAALWLAAINAIYRDVGHTLPFLTQIWMFLTPVLYTTESIMKNQSSVLRSIYNLNPMAGVVEGFRWALLGGTNPDWQAILISMGLTLCLLVGGLFFFRRLERTFADLV